MNKSVILWKATESVLKQNWKFSQFESSIWYMKFIININNNNLLHSYEIVKSIVNFSVKWTTFRPVYISYRAEKIQILA